MPDYFRRVTAGEPFRPLAPTWNAMLDAAQAHQQNKRTGGAPAGSFFRASDIIAVLNDSGADVGAFGILGIDGVACAPGTDLQEFVNRPILRGVTPTSDHTGKFIVALDGIAAGQVGLAVAAGVCVAKVEMQSSSHKCADVYANDKTKLKSAVEGSVQILYVESGTGTKWAIVRLGRSGGAAFEKVRVSGNLAGGGKYNGNVVKTPTAALSVSSNLTDLELGANGDSCVIYNAAEVGKTTHDLTAGTPVQRTFLAVYLGMSSEATPRRVYMINGFDIGECEAA